MQGRRVLYGLIGFVLNARRRLATANRTRTENINICNAATAAGNHAPKSPAEIATTHADVLESSRILLPVNNIRFQRQQWNPTHLSDAFPSSRCPGLGLVHDSVLFVYLFGLLERAVSGSLHLPFERTRARDEESGRKSEIRKESCAHPKRWFEADLGAQRSHTEVPAFTAISPTSATFPAFRAARGLVARVAGLHTAVDDRQVTNRLLDDTEGCSNSVPCRRRRTGC